MEKLTNEHVLGLIREFEDFVISNPPEKTPIEVQTKVTELGMSVIAAKALLEIGKLDANDRDDYNALKKLCWCIADVLGKDKTPYEDDLENAKTIDMLGKIADELLALEILRNHIGIRTDLKNNKVEIYVKNKELSAIEARKLILAF